MADAADLLDKAGKALAHGTEENRLVPLIASGKAPVPVLGALAAEQHRIINSDWRSFLALAARAAGPAEGAFFTNLAAGESTVLPKLAAFAAECRMDQAALEAYRPLAGCQAYPSYVAWLALNAEPTDVVLALTVNFAAWGSYCRTIAAALREHYRFPDPACAFFDFFAQPAPELLQHALTTLQSGLDSGRHTPAALEYARLLQAYELMFWNTLADHVP
jgi:TENA/THI-4/PQQC family